MANVSPSNINDLNNLVKQGKESIKSCQDTLNTYTAVINNNKAITNSNNKIASYMSKDRSAFTTLRSKFQDYLKDWENKRGDFAKWADIVSSVNASFNLDLDWYQCSDMSDHGDTNGACSSTAINRGYYDGGGFYASSDYRMSGACPCCWRGVRCSRRQGSKDKIMNDYNSVKPNFKTWCNSNLDKVPISECLKDEDGLGLCPDTNIEFCPDISTMSNQDLLDYPAKTQYPFKEETELPTLQCCTNIMATAGPSENNSQSCQQTIQQAADKLAEDETKKEENAKKKQEEANIASAQAAAKTPPTTPPTTPTTSTINEKVVSPSSTPSDEENKKKMYMYIAAGVLLLLLICCCCSSLLGVAASSGGNNK